MKNRPFFFSLALLWGAALYAQPGCSMFYPFREGVALEYASYGKDDKLESRTHTVVKKVKTLPNGAEALLASTIFDKRDKEQFSGEYTVRCEGGAVKMDASSLLGPGMQQSFSNMEVAMEGEGLVIPGQLKVGQKLPDASTSIRAGTRGVNVVDMTVSVTGRKVVGQETVSTPAGTFDCYKLSQTAEVKMMISKSFTTMEFYAPGVGVVRSETYDSQGELEGYTVLTSIKK